MDAKEILEALIAASDDKIWASELAFFTGARRIDFWTLQPTASQGFRASAYEIKVSRADFRRDSEDKQEGALRWSDRFWYVTPTGLLSRDELPAWAGLQEWDGKAFTVRKKAPPRQKQLPDWEFIVSLLRNSGDCRRDVEILKSQLAFHQWKAAQNERIQKMRDGMFVERFMRRQATEKAAT